MSIITSTSLDLVRSDSILLKTNGNKSTYSKEKSQTIPKLLWIYFMIFFQIIAYGSYSILVHLCEQNDQIPFSSITLNFLIEFFKLFLSLNAFIYLKKFHKNPLNILLLFKQSIPYSIPAILYFINNNLAVHMQIHMDPASYQILSNFKILTTAILYRLIIKQKFKTKQWFALILLFSGGILYSIGTLKNSSFISKTIIDSTVVMREMYIRPLGIPMIGVYCTLSGLAGVYNEWILKRNYNESLSLQNIYLYSYGTLFNFILILNLIRKTWENFYFVNLFHDFTSYTWLIVFTQILNGLFMSIVMKHFSNIIRLFVISFSLIVTAILSAVVFHIHFNIYFFISFITMISAISIYYIN